MTIVILLVLAGAWALALIPPWVRNRNESRPSHSIMSFQTELSTLRRAIPNGRSLVASGQSAYPSGARGHSVARKRRRDVLFSLAAGTVLTFAMALVFRGAALVAFLVAFALLCGYVASLIRVQRRVREREKVRYLVTRQSEPEPAMLLRRSASN